MEPQNSISSEKVWFNIPYYFLHNEIQSDIRPWYYDIRDETYAASSPTVLRMSVFMHMFRPSFALIDRTGRLF